MAKVMHNPSIAELLEAIKLEDKVIVISENKEDKNSILNIARLCDTIPYEVLVHISSSLRRSIL
jgi:alanine racemase